MNILVISREIPPVGGGAGAVALDLATHIAHEGHRVHILTMHFDGLPLLESRGAVTIQRLPCGRRHQDSADLVSMGRFVVKAGRSARKLVASDSIDLVHAHAIIPDGIAGRRATRGTGIPIVITAHGSDVPGYDPTRFGLLHHLLRPMWTRVVRQADLVTTPSAYLADLLRSTDSTVAVQVIPNGIRTDLLTPGELHRSGFLIVSRLIGRKNYAAFFEALARIDEPQVVDVVGDGPELQRLQDLAAATPHTVTFHGWLPHGSPEWRNLYEHSRFFVFPSRNENLPVNLLEAQLAGLTVLASDVPGNREVLGDHAIYFENLTQEGISATIRQALARSDTDLHDLGSKASQRVGEQFSWRTIADRFLQEFANLLEARHER